MVVQNCPDLINFKEGQEITMGDVVLKLVEVSNQYYLCQSAALNKTPKPETNNAGQNRQTRN